MIEIEVNQIQEINHSESALFEEDGNAVDDEYYEDFPDYNDLFEKYYNVFIEAVTERQLQKK